MIRSGNLKKENQAALTCSSPLFLAFLLYTLYIWGADVINLVCFFADLPQKNFLTWTVPLGCLCFLMWKMRGCIRFFKRDVTRLEWVGIGFLLLFGLYKMLLPDSSTDTINYHLYAQDIEFRNLVSADIAPGGKQSWFYPLADQLFYWFRMLLGYRLGTSLNSIAAVLIFQQMIAALRRIGYSRESTAGTSRTAHLLHREELWAFGAVCCFQILAQQGLYFTEILAGVFVMEGVFLLISPCEQRKEGLLFAFYLGLSAAMKLNNGIYIVPLLVLYLWKNRRLLTAKILAGGMLLAFVPVLPYALYNFVTTKNPVFPFANAVFGLSEVASMEGAFGRWGPQTWWETLLWPWMACLFPDYRQGEIAEPAAWMMLALYFVAATALVAILAKRRKCPPQARTLLILTAVSLLLWSALSGYARYAILCRMLVVLTVVSLLPVAESQRLSKALSAIGLCALLLQSAVTVQCVSQGLEWGWRPAPSSSFTLNVSEMENGALYQDSISVMFRDHSDRFGTERQKEQPEALVGYEVFSGWAELLNADVPIWNLKWLNEDASPQTREIGWDTIYKALDEQCAVYILYGDGQEEAMRENLENDGLCMLDSEEVKQTVFPGTHIWMACVQRLPEDGMES